MKLKPWKQYAIGPLADSTITDASGEHHLDKLRDEQLLDILSKPALHMTLVSENKRWISCGRVDVAERIRRDSEYEFNHYGRIRIEDPVDWTLGQPGQNNLNWQLHCMGYLADLAAAHAKTGDSWYLAQARLLIDDWLGANVANTFPSQFSWNDHSAALRLNNICGVYLYVLGAKGPDAPLLRTCLHAAELHLYVLACDDFYVRGTNHGLDQAFSLYRAAVVFPLFKESSGFRQIALERLSFELLKSFADDGVHIENSPEYHDMVLASTLQIDSFVHSMEGTGVLKERSKLVESALSFLAYIIRPDGKFPPIGDSLVRNSRNSFSSETENPAYQHYLYARSCAKEGIDFDEPHKVFEQSGYAVFRGDPSLFGPGSRPQLVFKCGYLSHYHRQDDDNNVVLFAHGEEWLTDGGLYLHDAGNPVREHLRSAHAHNVAVAGDGAGNRAVRPAPAPGIRDHGRHGSWAWVTGESGMYPGYVYWRRVSYDSKNIFAIDDRITASQQLPFPASQYWNIPGDKDIEIQGGTVLVSSRTSPASMRIEIRNGGWASIDLIKPGEVPNFGYHSQEYGTLKPIHVVRINHGIIDSLNTRTVVTISK